MTTLHRIEGKGVIAWLQASGDHYYILAGSELVPHKRRAASCTILTEFRRFGAEERGLLIEESERLLVAAKAGPYRRTPASELVIGYRENLQEHLVDPASSCSDRRCANLVRVLRHWRSVEPFKQFQLRTFDQQVVRISRPDQFAVSANSRSVAVYDERDNLIELGLHILHIEAD
ncbi:MAG: hypothetical protein KY476_01655 [Planctomycetes bacterium]|nr:hypothetical protein [Planctomycetota bacterium]